MSRSSQNNIGGLSAEMLLCTIKGLTRTCFNCGDKMLDFCMEQCCSGSPVFCRSCSADHTTHNTNELQVLFINNNHYTTERQLL